MRFYNETWPEYFESVTTPFAVDSATTNRCEIHGNHHAEHVSDLDESSGQTRSNCCRSMRAEPVVGRANALFKRYPGVPAERVDAGHI